MATPDRPRFVATLALALAVAACAGPTEFGAAGDIHALMVAIRDDDQGPSTPTSTGAPSKANWRPS